MEQLVQQLADKVGLDEATAQKVADFIKDHISDIPGWLGQVGAGDLLDKAKDMFNIGG